MAVPFLSCPVIRSVTSFPETATTSTFRQSMPSLVFALIASQLPYFTYVPTETPGLYCTAKTGATNATKRTEAKATATFDVESKIFRLFQRIQYKICLLPY